jgi:choline kinase
MRAVILAAGRGSRMDGLTADRPKCLVELAGVCLLDLQVAALRAGGAGEIAVVAGYRGDMLAGRGLHVFENSRWSETNMVMSLASAGRWLAAAPCLVSYADIFYPAETVRRLRAADGDIVLSYDPDWLEQWCNRFADPLSDAESFRLDPAGRVIEIGEKATDVSRIEGQYMGLLKFTPDGWRTVTACLDALTPADRDRLDMTALLSRLVQDGAAVTAVPTAPGWGEVDSGSDLDYFAGEIEAGRLKLEMPAATARPRSGSRVNLRALRSGSA